MTLSIYIHWPFCKSKCPYCDFNSHVRDGVDDERWQKALLKELEYYAQKLPGREVVSIFFGGGTPSLMPAKTAAALIDAVGKFWKVSDNIEITLEANPTSIEAQKFRDFRAGGVNRVSVGVQSLVPEDLKFLGREHNVDEALAALKLARDIFPRMSFDLIYTRPNQTLTAWEKELSQALEFAKDHLSLYQLTIEENTAFHHLYHSGKFEMPEENIAADMYDLTQAIMEAHGLPAYEISNHAKLGSESRHNLAYWKSDDYIGIGPGAHGRLCWYKEASEDSPPSLTLTPSKGGVLDALERIHTRTSTENIKSPERWLEQVEQLGNGLTAQTALTEKELSEELVMMGLRLSSGIDYADWKQRTGIDMKNMFLPKTLDRLQELSLVSADDKHIRVTKQGRLLLNGITRELLAASHAIPA